MIEPLVVELRVDVPPAAAFATWTDRCRLWWPREHTVSGDPAAITFEPHPGGRIVETGRDGRDHTWGEVLEWRPPELLRYRWHPFFAASEATEVTVTFSPAPDSPAATSVRLVQTGFERLGRPGAERRDRTRHAWGNVTARYVAACAAS